MTLLALGVMMDACAVSICLGLNMKKVTFKKALIVGLYFGVFQVAFALVGYFAGTLFADKISSWSHWAAFGILLVLGVQMIWGGIKKDEKQDDTETSLGPKKLLPLAIATSIDALAVGISLAFVNANMTIAGILIGVFTLVFSMLCVKIGNIFGLKYKSGAEIAGGIILILIGIKIVLSAYGVIGF